MHPGSRVLCSASPAILPRLSQLCQNGRLSILSSIGKSEKSMVGWGRQSYYFWSKIPWLKRKCTTVRCRNAAASSFVFKVRAEVFARIHAVAIKRHSSMRNWLFGLPGRILCKQSPSCQRKLCACSLLFFSPVSPTSVCPELSTMYGSCFLPRTLV
jgi:hypothetical protein